MHPAREAQEAGEDLVTAAQACQQLGLSPHALRQILREYEDLFDGGRPGPDRFRPADVRRLATIARLQAEGASGEAIRAALLAGGETAGRVPPAARVDQPPVWRAALERLERLDAAVRALERRWGEDRDRLLLALLRVQQELAALRQQLAPRGRRG